MIMGSMNHHFDIAIGIHQILKAFQRLLLQGSGPPAGQARWPCMKREGTNNGSETLVPSREDAAFFAINRKRLGVNAVRFGDCASDVFDGNEPGAMRLHQSLHP